MKTFFGFNGTEMAIKSERPYTITMFTHTPDNVVLIHCAHLGSTEEAIKHASVAGVLAVPRVRL